MASWTTRSLLAWTIEALGKRGVQSARLDAELLLAHVLNIDRLQLFMEYDRPASVEECTAYRALVQRRLGGSSCAAILGRREFYGRDFAVGDHVLIPRPETEGLVDRILDRLRDESLSFVDLGTGSGCIGVTLACERSGWQGLLVEQDDIAAGYAQKNIRHHHGQKDHLSLCVTDALQPEQWSQGQKYDLLVANPPYLTRTEWQSASAEVKNEPLGALCYGDNPDGADWYRALFGLLADLMAADGTLALEIGIAQAKVLFPLLAEAGAVEIEILRDFSDHERYLFARWPKEI